ncbi:MAG: hypothetical protein FJ284_02990 [Planctomycetes bacterium]|nr:hypothetical protein [Planctomycetota bacterium]
MPATTDPEPPRRTRVRWLTPRLLRGCLAACLLGAACLTTGAVAAADAFEEEPISAVPRNAVAALQHRLDTGAATLAFDARSGYIAAVLAALDVPVASQTLVFSKTSLQVSTISPHNPRALYFNDDVYVGFVRGGDVLEISVADPALGTVFYTLDQSPSDRPRFMRQTDDCLLCHGGPKTGGVPGHVLRSVYPDATGQPIYAAGSHRVDHATPFEHRWGGWYVTGGTDGLTHLGNTTYRRAAEGRLPDADQSRAGGPRDAELAGYPALTSDVVAHLVLAHQVHGHNAVTQASFSVRQALHREAALNRELGEPPGYRWPSTDTVLDAAAMNLVNCFLFAGEPPLPTPLGTDSPFAHAFAATGPSDGHGRSLRELDLRTRLLRHPCSHLIYTASFDALPAELRDRFWTRLAAALAEGSDHPATRRLAADDRQAIREIIAATKPTTPANWAD